ncbi:Nematode resistance protein HSPRO1 [Spatholobus suberectus]|nr:Nematode resistance protein HSPRO1 [Spatholobus suberectus]
MLFCFKSKESVVEVTLLYKELRHKVQKIIKVKVDPKVGPKIQEAVTKLYVGQARVWKPRGGYYDRPDSGSRIWHSDDDKGNWGVAEPNIDMKAEAFIAEYKKRVSESALYQVNPAAENA